MLFFFFFFKQKTAYEMLRSLVGSEMCIRDRYQRRVRGSIVKSMKWLGSLTLVLLSLAAGQPSGYLYVADRQVHAIHRLSHTGAYLGQFVKRRSGGLRLPAAFAFWSPTQSDSADPDSFGMVSGVASRRDLYVCSAGTESVLQYDGLSGRFVRQLCEVRGRPSGLAFHNNVLYVSSRYHSTLLRFRASTGAPLGVLARGAPFTGLHGPTQIGFDDAQLLVSSSSSKSILKFERDDLDRCFYSESPCSNPGNIWAHPGPVKGFALGDEAVYACLASGSVSRLNSTTGDLMSTIVLTNQLQEANPEGITWLRGQLLVGSSDGRILRWSGLTGEWLGAWNPELVYSAGYLVWD
eukprot:TRINITY_DN1734_c0_g1_i1.p1 TRINITY_DN1734_c0_g1~~TRINITY_DN1734_c0_g1_i1.p1  ORF type:complete len:350 (-),score=62.88 TRINITY_DN1734_c0_g1_i1:350-1399(-)